MEAPTGEEAAAYDRRAIEELDVPEATLMENAGRSAAQVLERLFPRGDVVGLVGGGNNGGDALVLLRTLAAWGRSVRAIFVSDRREDDPLLHGWPFPVRGDRELQGAPGAYDGALGDAPVLVDGILGTGIRGAPRERQAAAIKAVNRSGARVLALDLPSGVDATTGSVPGEAVAADVTVAFGWPKLGSLLHPGRDRVGRLVAVEIGFPPPPEEAFRARVITPAWAAAHRPARPPETHKYAVGALTVVAGRSGMAGASLLAVRAALRSGVGLLRVASAPENRTILQGGAPEAIFVDADDPEALGDGVEGGDALVIGPGLGVDGKGEERLKRALEARGGRPLLLDADALTLIGAGRGPDLEELAARGPVLLTPHPGEMARLVPGKGDRIREDRVEVARELAAATGCAVLLKGLPSLVADPEGGVRVDSVGTSDLATAGMGDLLSGVCGSFLAQGVPPARAGALGLFVSGRAALRAGGGSGLLPSDVIQRLPGAVAERGPGESNLQLPFVSFDQDRAR